MAFDIAEELKKLPGSPGVYIMHGPKDEIIYVGKAVSLKNRVRQYFQSSRGKSLKIVSMVSRITRFEYIVTDSELEALVLENNLIKEHRPKYNTMLKDDKTYPYIRVTLSEAYPRIQLTRSIRKDADRYYGPYTNAGAVRNTIDLTRKLFHLRSCDKKLPSSKKERPCLYHEIGQCPAPCAGLISEEDYRKNAEAAVDFLNGNAKDVLLDLKRKMTEASDAMDYESAMEYRDLIESVEAVREKQKITGADLNDRDIVAVAREGTDAVAQVFFIREGKMIGREHFYLRASEEDSDAQVLSSFITQYYAGTTFIPGELMIPETLPEEELVLRFLKMRRGRRVRLIVPKRGTKEKLVELAAENAKTVLTRDKERLIREEGRTIGAVKEIASLLKMEHISRMEAFDISNISGFESVGSMVVFEGGKPKKSDYRKFRIRTVNGPDDYASMREVLTRRFARAKEESRGFEILPDLLLMDGGKGQVNIALEVLAEAGLSIPVAGMVKDDYHNTRGLYYNNEELPIDRSSEGFKLITRIQDEAHRFAIEYHRLLRSKGQVKSVLDEIEGIGPARRKALLRAFGSAEAIRKADVDRLAAVSPMTKEAAKKVYDFFHSGESQVYAEEEV